MHLLEVLVSSVWASTVAQAGNTPTFGDVLPQWDMRDSGDWLLVEAPQEVQHILE